MNAKHTPGPWYVSGTNPPIVYARDGLDIICQCATMSEETRAHEMATAHLIAAAPDLLAALAGCADALSEAGKDFAVNNPLAVRPNLYELHASVARAAIAKAKGEL